MNESQRQGTVRKYAIELLNSSFMPLSRFWFEDECAMELFYKRNLEIYRSAFMRKIKAI